MNLGAFSISLAVKDIKASRAFYERLGFEELGDSGSPHFCMLKNGNAVIGLFEGMFDANIMTFRLDPGRDAVRSVRRCQRYRKIAGRWRNRLRHGAR
jgi:catechol 2,3-dioxygenase-like lactoylglutathione lyase family enzyme